MDKKINKLPVICIYSVTNNINNKIYIGQTIDVERRWNQHKYGKGNILLRNSIKKYGVENFTFSILEIVNNENKSKLQISEELSLLEQKWFDIKEPFLNKNGYNIQKTYKPNLTPNRDKYFGEKISRIKIENNHTGKSTIQYDLNANFIKEWKSAAVIERTMGFKAENISACCLGKSKSSNGFIWKFKGIKLNDDDIIKVNSSLRLSEVRQYNLKGEQLGVFLNTKEASKITKINESTIRQACGGHIKTGGGFIWKFRNEKLVLLEHINKKNKIDYQNTNEN